MTVYCLVKLGNCLVQCVCFRKVLKNIDVKTQDIYIWKILVKRVNVIGLNKFSCSQTAVSHHWFFHHSTSSLKSPDIKPDVCFWETSSFFAYKHTSRGFLKKFYKTLEELLYRHWSILNCCFWDLGTVSEYLLCGRILSSCLWVDIFSGK